jgi:predicted nucleotidyltransferase
MCLSEQNGATMSIIVQHLTADEQQAIALLTTRLRQQLGDNLHMMRLFGSKARGDATHESDIDILIIVKERTVECERQISAIAVDVDFEYNTNVSPIVYSQHEYEMNCRLGSPFIKDIAREGIPL